MLKHYVQNQTIATLDKLKGWVDHETAAYLPDYDYNENKTGELAFEPLPMRTLTQDLFAAEPVGVTINEIVNGKREKAYYRFTDWSRQQLLTRMGTREAWFEHVTEHREAQELSSRLHVLHGAKFRVKKLYKEDSHEVLREVRGLVSRRYVDYPNVQVMQDLAQVLPLEKSYYLKSHSGITDRAFYCTYLVDSPISLDGQNESYPGVMLKNSEVGYTSLWLIPVLYTPKHGSLYTLEAKTFFRIAHRGSLEKFEEQVQGAVANTSTVWAGVKKKLESLSSRVHFASEDEALEWMRNALTSLKATKRFQNLCEKTYKEQNHLTHGGLQVLQAVGAATNPKYTFDDSYRTSAIAGALLLYLLRTK